MDNDFPHFSDAEYTERERRVREVMSESGVDVLVLYGNASGHNEIMYLTNHAVSREATLVFPLEGEPTLIVHFSNHQQTASRLSRVSDVRWDGDDVGEAAARCLRERGLEGARVGIAGPWPHYRHRSFIEGLGGAEPVGLDGKLYALRIVKSPEEIAWVREGARFSDLAIAALEEGARPGMTEYELAALVESAYVPLGGTTHIHFIGVTSMASPGLCAPAQTHSARRLRQNDVIMTEISAMKHGYWGQILRTFTVGAPPTPLYRSLHGIAEETFTAITSVLRDGATSEELLDAAEAVHQHGYTIYDDMVHFTVGGVYAPYLRTRRTMAKVPSVVYREGMVVVVQPNVITKDHQAGVQFGEMLVVTRAEPERLHTAERRMLRCG